MQNLAELQAVLPPAQLALLCFGQCLVRRETAQGIAFARARKVLAAWPVGPGHVGTRVPRSCLGQLIQAIQWCQVDVVLPVKRARRKSIVAALRDVVLLRVHGRPP